MTKLTKAHLKERDEISGKLQEKREALDEALTKFNELVADAFSNEETGLKAAIDSYNEELSAARSWAENIAGEIGDYYDGKSEKWQASDKGDAFSSWKDAFAELEAEDIDVDEPEPLEIDAEDVAEMIEQLPEEPEA